MKSGKPLVNFQYFVAHTIAAVLGDEYCKRLLFMHVFLVVTGVIIQYHSSFSGIGRKNLEGVGLGLYGMFGDLYPTGQPWDVWRH